MECNKISNKSHLINMLPNILCIRAYFKEFFLDLTMLHYLIHELYLTNHLSFLELLNCGTHCHPLLSLNPTICHLLNLTSTNLILSPSLLKLPLIFSGSPLSGLCYRPNGLSRHNLLKKEQNAMAELDNTQLLALLGIKPFR